METNTPFPYPDEKTTAAPPTAKPAAASVPAELQQKPSQVPVAAGPSTELVDATKLTTLGFKASFTRDFKGVPEKDRSNFVSALCKVLDIPTPLNPFYFIPANNKEVLYAGIEAAQLLAESKKLNVEIRGKTLDDANLYTIGVRVTGPTGRFCDNEGIMYLGGLTGEKRGNAMMKAITKAQRRAILSYCGLSMTDDADTQGDYGQPANPLADRTQTILQDRLAANAEKPVRTVIADADGVRQLGKETREARGDLFKALLGGKDAPFKNAIEAEAWVKAKTNGLGIHQLDAEQCSDLWNDLIEEEHLRQEAGQEPEVDDATA